MEKVLINYKAGDKTGRVSVDQFTELTLLAELVVPEKRKDYIAAVVDGKLREMNYYLENSSDVEFIGIDSTIGFDIYKRGLTLLMIKAFDDVLHSRPDYNIDVMYSLGSGYFCRISDNIRLTDELITEVKNRMNELVEGDIPLDKRSFSSHEARMKFASMGLKDKVKLLNYRRVSRINLYNLAEEKSHA